MQDYRNWPTKKLVDEKILLKSKVSSLEKRGAMLNLTQKKQLSTLRASLRLVSKLIGERHVQLPLI